MEILKHINSIKDTRCKMQTCYKSAINMSCHECTRTNACLRSCTLRNVKIDAPFRCEEADKCISFINYLRIKKEFENGRDIKDDK